MTLIFTLIIGIAVAVVFHSLTVEVDDDEVRWHFGPGFWTYRLARDEIRNVAVVRNHWWNGFGIRTAPGFRLYNASGLDAVEPQPKSGDIRRIGPMIRKVLRQRSGRRRTAADHLPYSSR
ncbi:hypothetical protein [Bradyrhizobium sp.]|uniref:hypothetical protein n=1 Tax=Bradyrhizobium sp. TaxID=376 RepID=UPI003C71AB4D